MKTHLLTPTHTHTHTHTHARITKALLLSTCCKTDISGVSLWGEQTECWVMKSSVKNACVCVHVSVCVCGRLCVCALEPGPSLCLEAVLTASWSHTCEPCITCCLRHSHTHTYTHTHTHTPSHTLTEIHCQPIHYLHWDSSIFQETLLIPLLGFSKVCVCVCVCVY